MKIALLGDIAFFGKFSLQNNQDLFNYFKDVAEELKKYDLVIGNLETPFVNSYKPFGYKSAYIKSEPINVELLKYLNISVVNLSNNHVFDFGSNGFQLTKKILNDNGIKFFGIEDKQLVIESGENKIALNGYCCYSTNPLGINNKNNAGINELNFLKVENTLKENHNQGLYNILSVHCGQEHVNYPNYDHIELARKLADVTPYIFYGHHPHVIQGIEKIKDSLIAYSLGNFCFDDVYTKKSAEPLIKQTENNKKSFILEVIIEHNKLADFNVIPIYLAADKMQIRSNEIIENLNLYSEKLNDDKDAYITFREQLVNNYITSRKSSRNLNWYLKRLNHKYAILMLTSRENKKKYFNSVKKYLTQSN